RSALLIILFFYSFSLQANILRVGMELSYPPFETICFGGKPCGISVEIANAMGEFLKVPVKIDNIPFVGLIPSLKNGSIDLIISSLTVTNERERAIDFSDRYAMTGLCLLLNIDSKLNDIENANQRN